ELQAIIAPSTLLDNGEFAEYDVIRPRALHLDAYKVYPARKIPNRDSHNILRGARRSCQPRYLAAHGVHDPDGHRADPLPQRVGQPNVLAVRRVGEEIDRPVRKLRGLRHRALERVLQHRSTPAVPPELGPW